MGFSAFLRLQNRTADDNVDEPGRSALVRRGGDEGGGRWCAVDRLPLLADGSAPGMLIKHNDDRRHPISTMTFTVTNWAIYEGGTTGPSTFAPSPRTKDPSKNNLNTLSGFLTFRV